MSALPFRAVYVAAVLLGGCTAQIAVSASASIEARTDTEPVAPLRAVEITPGEGAVEAHGVCDAAAGEACNALDDDCDGQIDEGCGIGNGQIQVTATWNSGADIDLYVIDPAEEVVSFQRRRALSGGHLDYDARGDCREGQSHDRLENAVWAETAPPGRYKVQLHYLFECDSGAGLTTATVSVSVGGEVIGSWNQRVAPNETADVVTFTVE